MPSGSRGFALASGLLHKSARHNPQLGIKHLGLNRSAVVTRGTVRCHHLIFLHSR
jgi:hypothetical protein